MKAKCPKCKSQKIGLLSTEAFVCVDCWYYENSLGENGYVQPNGKIKWNEDLRK